MRTVGRAGDRRLVGGWPRSRRYARMLTGAGGVLLLSGCSGRDLALPPSASDNADYYDSLWLGAWVAAGVVGVFVFGLMVWTMVRYRRRSDEEIPAQVRYNLPIEVLYTVAPVIVVAAFFFHTVEAGQAQEDQPAPEHTVLVVGQKWSWSFNYVEDEALGGGSVHTVGTPAERPTLVVPVGEPVEFDLRSQDVIHSFWVPAFYFKMDVVPGRDNSFTLTPTREGTYAGRCSELCGLYHSRMLFTVEVVSPDEYDQALQDLATDPDNRGIVLGNSSTDDIVGLEPEGPGQSTTEDGAPQ